MSDFPWKNNYRWIIWQTLGPINIFHCQLQWLDGLIGHASDRPRLSQEQPWPRLSKADGPGGDGIAGAFTTIGHYTKISGSYLTIGCPHNFGRNVFSAAGSMILVHHAMTSACQSQPSSGNRSGISAGRRQPHQCIHMYCRDVPLSLSR